MSENPGSKETFALQNAIEDPKSSHGGTDLPCGYVAPDGKLYREVWFREITGAEEDVMTSRSLSGPDKITIILGNCITRLGPFTDEPTLKRIAGELLLGDRVFCLVGLRKISLGSDYPLEEVCPSCKRAGYYELDLNELEVKHMPHPEQRTYTVALSSGTAVLHPLTGRDEARAAKLSAPGDLATLNLLFHLDTLNGEPPTLEAVKKLPLRDRNLLRDTIEAFEGGVDTSLEITCPHCGVEFQLEVDLTRRGFFSPSSTRRDLRKKYSSSWSGSPGTRTAR